MRFRMLSAAFVFVFAMTCGDLLAQGVQGTANPELVGSLAKAMGSTPQQAEGAAGALFGFAQTKLSPADWGKVAGSVSGMDGLLKAAPPLAMGAAGTSGVGGLAGAAAGLGGLASLAGPFTKLGLKPDMILKAVPVLTNFVTKSGGAAVGQLLAGVLK